MQKIYSLLCAACFAGAAMAQTPAKAGGQAMPINAAEAVHLYTNEAFSWEGHYDYYFSFGNDDDEYGFPIIEFDIYLPSNDGLKEGTYKMSEKTIDENLILIANYNDYISYYYGYAAYQWTDATVRLTKGEDQDVWTVDFSATTVDDYTYTFTYTGEFPIVEDDFDPNAKEPEPEEEYSYKYEPQTKSEMNIVFDTPDCSDAYVDDYYIYDIFLDTDQKDANGRNYEARLYLITKEHQPHADFYPINDSGALNTFLASQGCSMTSNSKDTPCYLRTYDSNYVYDSWYMVAGYVNLSYDAEGKVALEGDAETYNGSKVHFSTRNLPAGLNTVIADTPRDTRTKVFRNGRILVGGKYNLSGVHCKQ